TGRTYGCKRSDLTKKLLCHGGRPHMGPRFRRDDTELVARSPAEGFTSLSPLTVVPRLAGRSSADSDRQSAGMKRSVPARRVGLPVSFV
ncbi:hypothetical protein FBF71_43915, partial [Bradyrhizobium elkanii]|nr:hypothetical protein [Bradyrhizobium elkanii]NWL74843.1 hypothetical protein [Bradyrhizobium elkanii]